MRWTQSIGWLAALAILLPYLPAAVGVSRRANQAERRRHPRRRPRLLRPGLLRRRDPDAEPRRAGRGGPAVHPVLQHGAVLADAGGDPDRLLRPAGPARHGARRAERRPGHPAGLGPALARDAPAARLPVLPLGQVARRRDAAAERVRPLLLRSRTWAATSIPRVLYEDDRKLPPVKPGSGYYTTTAIADHGDQVPQGARGGARRPSRSSSTWPSRAAFPAPGACRRTSRGIAADTARAGRPSAPGDGGGSRSSAWSTAACRTWSARSGRPTTSPTRLQALGPGEVNRPLPWDDLTAEQRSVPGDEDGDPRRDGRPDGPRDRPGARPGPRDGRPRGHADPLPLRQRRERRDHGPRRRPRPLGARRLGGHAPLPGPGWSTVANTPFRRHKTWVHEGGIATPLIVHWPRGNRRPGRDPPRSRAT